MSLIVEARRLNLLERDVANRRRALVLNAQALSQDGHGHRAAAIALARQAVRADLGLTDATLNLARWVGEGSTGQRGDRRRALRLLQRAWTHTPVPALAAAAIALEADLAPLDRLRHLETLVSGQPAHVESLLVLGAASLDAKLWGQARKLLSDAAALRPTALPYRLLARLESEGYNDPVAARHWLDLGATAAPDPLWHCRTCGRAESDWAMRCGTCGTIDGFVWRSPAQARITAATVGPVPHATPAGFATPPSRGAFAP